MDLTNLQVSLNDLLSDEDLHVFEMLARLVDREDWDKIASYLSSELAADLKAKVQSDGKKNLLGSLRRIIKNETEKQNIEIKQALKNATSVQLRGSLGDKLVQFHKRAGLQNRKSNLLAVAFADRLTDLIFPAADRAAKLSELIVRERPTQEAEKYLEEACLCYFYELYSASAVMCRSILEEVIEKRIGQIKNHLPKGSGETPHTLGALLGFAEGLGALGAKVVPREARREVQKVNSLANRAVHQNPILEEEACDCLAAARYALGWILK